MINPANNKLLSIIDSFSKVELNRLSKFVQSPYFNSNKDIQLLYNKIISEFESGLKFTKEELWLSISTNSNFNSLRFRKISSDLLKLVEQFLAQEIYDNNKLLKANFLLEAASTRGLKKLFSTTQTNALRESEKSLLKESQFYLHQYQREKLIYELKNSDLDRSSQSNVDQIINHLDYFYLAEKMRYLCEIIIRENVISMDYNILFRDEIVNHLKKYNYQETPVVAIYFQMYLTLTEDRDENYYRLKEMLEENLEIFPRNEIREIYTSAINYCLKKINFGNNDFLVEFLELNETLLEKNIIEEGGLSPWKFKNIVTAGLKLSKFEWVKTFIDSYKDKINVRYRENAITFNTAQLYFYQKRYEELLPLLLQVDYEDFTYSLSSKLLTCITYYELNEIEALMSYLDSFRTYLSRHNRISKAKKKWNANFISNTKKLLKYSSHRKVNLLELERNIKENKDTAAKEWLLEKIDQLLYPNAKQRIGSMNDDPFQKKQAQ